ncbi:MAG: OmpA family protein [Myxococcota bacterium]
MKRYTLVLCAVMFAPAALLAQEQRFEVQRFHPPANQSSGYWNAQSANLMEPGLWQTSIVYNHAQDPLVFRNSADEVLGRVVRRQGGGNFLAVYGVHEYFELGLDVPLILYQDGESLPTVIGNEADAPGTGIGDIRVLPTLGLPEIALGPGLLDLAFAVDIALPTGEQEVFQGGGLRVQPRAIAEYGISRLGRVVANVGYAVRDDDAEVLFLEVDDAITWGAGVVVPTRRYFQGLPVDALDVLLDVTGEVVVGAESLSGEEAPTEFLGGVRARWGTLGAHVAGGAGITRTNGVPAWRVVAGVSFSAGEPRDSDGDGIPNIADACAAAAEDLDYFEDEDGCPELDNDGDSLVDVLDSCPNQPEDENGFEDGDGCPDQHVLDARLQKPKELSEEEKELAALPKVIAGGGGDAGYEACRSTKAGHMICAGEPALSRVVIYFGNDSTKYLDESLPAVREAIRATHAHPQVKHVWIEGHADDRESGDYNAALSQKRASEVRELLVRAGISPKRLSTAGFSDRYRLGSGKDEVTRIMNKRVEFRIASRQDARPGAVAIAE